MTVKLLMVPRTELLGDLIAEFARGETPKPATVDELNALLLERNIVDPQTAEEKANGIERHWPNGRPENPVIDYMPLPSDQLTILLPDTSSIDEGPDLAKQLSPDGAYPLAPGYDRAYVGDRQTEFSNEEWEEIYRTRLGDYTMTKCM